MKRLPSLYALLSALVASSTIACGGCPPAQEETIAFDAQAESLAASFARCEQDASDCEDLCRGVYKLMYGADNAEYVYFSECELVDVDDMPAVHYLVSQQCIGGRRPHGAALSDEQCASSEAGAWFAKLAELEEASVYAFVMLSKELRLLGAPASLSQRCLRAAADEVQHARAIAALAKRFGAVVEPIGAPALSQPRSLVEVAVENAREGCVRETYGALVALWQAQHASELVVREAMAKIAIDESRHAELSADIDAWARTVLDAQERAQLDQAKAQAIACLAESIGTASSPELIASAGLPDQHAGAMLFAEARESIWA